ncbi:hypothetical protein [Streptomyces sp. NPDC058674]|uniref:hypothetical protein n=1 Tax=Streptomyces sp. NPDC058674 TaxID=3346592 RepID=UPI003647E7E2
MTATTRDQAPVAIAGDGVELRLQEIGGGFSVAFMRLSQGMEMAPALKGLPDDLCPCPHWGYLLKGTLRMHTKEGTRDYTAGEAFYWAPGHAPEAVEDVEYVDFSPTEEFRTVIDHVTSASQQGCPPRGASPTARVAPMPSPGPLGRGAPCAAADPWVGDAHWAVPTS